MLHRAIVADEYGDVNALANVAAAPSAEAARALDGARRRQGKTGGEPTSRMAWNAAAFCPSARKACGARLRQAAQPLLGARAAPE